MIRWSEFRALQRRASSDVSVWSAIGRSIYNQDGELVAEFRDPEVAALETDRHNHFAEICNLVVFLAAKLKDARTIGASNEKVAQE